MGYYLKRISVNKAKHTSLLFSVSFCVCFGGKMMVFISIVILLMTGNVDKSSMQSGAFLY